MCLNERFSSSCMRRTQSSRLDSGKRHRGRRREASGTLGLVHSCRRRWVRMRSFWGKNRVLEQNDKLVGQNKKFWGKEKNLGGETKKNVLLGGKNNTIFGKNQKFVPCEFVCAGSAMKAKQRRWGGRSKTRRWDADKEGKVTLRRSPACALLPTWS